MRCLVLPLISHYEHTIAPVLTSLCRSVARSKEEDLFLAFWVSKTSCNLMVEKIEKSYVGLFPFWRTVSSRRADSRRSRSALSLRLYAEDVTPHAKGKAPPQSRPAAKSEDTTATGTPAESSAGTPAAVQEAVDQEDGDKVKAVEAADQEEAGEATA